MFMGGRTDEQTTDGRQAHRYIPRTCRSGIKTKALCDQQRFPVFATLAAISGLARTVWSVALGTRLHSADIDNMGCSIGVIL